MLVVAGLFIGANLPELAASTGRRRRAYHAYIASLGSQHRNILEVTISEVVHFVAGYHISSLSANRSTAGVRGRTCGEAYYA